MIAKIINSNGKKIVIHNFENNQANGLVEIFNDKEEKLYEFYMKSNKINSPIIIQKDNQITKIENFNEKGPIGKIQIQDTDSHKNIIKETLIENFENNKINGKVEIKQNQEKFTGIFQQGTLNGEFQKIKNKQLIEGHFLEGQKHGKFISKSENKILNTNFKKNILDGNTTLKTEDLSTKLNIKNGIIKPPSKFFIIFKFIYDFSKSILITIMRIIPYVGRILFYNNIIYVYKLLKKILKKFKF